MSYPHKNFVQGETRGILTKAGYRYDPSIGAYRREEVEPATQTKPLQKKKSFFQIIKSLWSKK